MPSLQQAVFPARFAALRDAATFVQRFCETNGMDRDDALRLRLVIEELFTNTVQHGHGGESEAPIRVALELRDDRVRVLYEDTAPRYDPIQTRTNAESALDAAPEARPVGGLGLALLRALVADSRYVYEDGKNRLWLTVLCRQAGGDRPAPSGSLGD